MNDLDWKTIESMALAFLGEERAGPPTVLPVLLFAALFAFIAMAVKCTVECDGQENVSFTADLNGSDVQVDELFRTIVQMKKNAVIG